MRMFTAWNQKQGVCIPQFLLCDSYMGVNSYIAHPFIFGVNSGHACFE